MNITSETEVTILRNLSKIEFIHYPYFWKLINDCRKGRECKLVFCQKCNPKFDDLFDENQRKQIHEILINSPANEDIIYYPRVSSEYVLKKFQEKFVGQESEHNTIIHWDWIIILNNPQPKYKFTNFLIKNKEQDHD